MDRDFFCAKWQSIRLWIGIVIVRWTFGRIPIVNFIFKTLTQIIRTIWNGRFTWGNNLHKIETFAIMIFVFICQHWNRQISHIISTKHWCDIGKALKRHRCLPRIIWLRCRKYYQILHWIWTFIIWCKVYVICERSHHHNILLPFVCWQIEQNETGEQSKHKLFNIHFNKYAAFFVVSPTNSRAISFVFTIFFFFVFCCLHTSHNVSITMQIPYVSAIQWDRLENKMFQTTAQISFLFTKRKESAIFWNLLFNGRFRLLSRINSNIIIF